MSSQTDLVPEANRPHRARTGELLVIAALLFMLNIFMLQPGQNRNMVDDSQIPFRGATSQVDANRYLNSQASFSNAADTAFTLPGAEGARRIILRVWDFDYGPATLTASDGSHVFTTETPGSGQGLVEINLEGPFSAPLDVQVTYAQRPAFLLDTVTYEYAEPNLQLWLWVFGLTLVPLFIIYSLSRFIDFPMPTTGKVYPSLDIARAVAVLFVLLLHARGYSGLGAVAPQNLFDLFASNGQFGVEIFYVLSAFTLSFSLIKQMTDPKPHPLGNFWIRRIARILPSLIFLFFAISAAKIWFLGEEHDLGTLVFRLLTMSYIFDDAVRLSLDHTVWWSVATEFQFYLIMPILFAAPLAWANGNVPKTLIVAAGVPLGGIIIAMLATHYLHDKAWLGYSLLYHAIPFSAGIGLASLASLIPIDTRIPVHVRGALLILSVAGVIMSVAWFDVLDDLGPKTGIVAVVAATCVAILCGRLFDSGSRALADFPILRSVGILSFLIYLLHVPVMQAIRWAGGSSLLGSLEGVYALMFVSSLTISWVIGLVIHRVIETPALNGTALASRTQGGMFLTYAYVTILLVSAFFALAIY